MFLGFALITTVLTALVGSSLSLKADTLQFAYPNEGQVLDYEGSYMFKVNEIARARGYLWGFFQNGGMVWEDCRDQQKLSGREYGIHPGTPARGSFSPGQVEIWVRAWIDNHWTDAEVITVRLRSRCKIQRLEAQLKKMNGRFSWKLHNDLRHEYRVIDPHKSAEHSNIILRHCPMDQYIVNILSGWQLGKNEPLAIERFQEQAERFADLPFLRAACLIKIGDLHCQSHRWEQAGKAYQEVVSTSDQGLAAYRNLAIGQFLNLLVQWQLEQDQERNNAARYNCSTVRPSLELAL